MKNAEGKWCWLTRDHWENRQMIAYCQRCGTPKCERLPEGKLPCVLTCPTCDGIRLRLRPEHWQQPELGLWFCECGALPSAARVGQRALALEMLKLIESEQTVLSDAPNYASVDYHEGGRERALVALEIFRRTGKVLT